MIPISVVYRHRFDADPYPDPDPNWYGINTMPIHRRILPQILHMLKNRGNNFTFIHSNASLCKMFFFSHQRQMCHNFKYFEQHIEIYEKSKNACVLN